MKINLNTKLENFLDKHGISISFYSILIGLGVIAYFFLMKPFNDWSFETDPQLFSDFGDFIGGLVGPIFTLAGFILIFKTFRAQQKTYDQQEELKKEQHRIFEQERFETTFFNLLKSQNLITSDFKVYFHSLKEIVTEVTHTIIGREFFLYSKRELIDIWNSFNSKVYAGYFSPEIAQYRQEDIDELYNPDSTKFTHPDDAIEQERVIKYEIRLSQVNRFYGIDGPIWDRFKKLDTLDKIKMTYGLFFQRYHYAAGHYFRHLYHILDFIEKSEQRLLQITDEKDKEMVLLTFQKYASFVQAQMSSFELLLLFYNSFSFPKMLRLIKKYNIIENLTIEDLIDKSHDFDKEIKLKRRQSLI